MDKLHLWTVWLLVSAGGLLDPCQGKLKDGSQLDHQLAPTSSTGPGRALKPPVLWGPISGKPKGCEGKGQADFKGDMDVVWNLTPLEFKFLPGLHMAKWPCLLPSSPWDCPAGAANIPISNMGVPGFLSWWSPVRYLKICFHDPKAAPKECCSVAVGICPSHCGVSVQAAPTPAAHLYPA